MSVAKTVAQRLFGDWGYINPAAPSRAERPPRTTSQPKAGGEEQSPERVRQRGGGGAERREYPFELPLSFLTGPLTSLNPF